MTKNNRCDMEEEYEIQIPFFVFGRGPSQLDHVTELALLYRKNNGGAHKNTPYVTEAKSHQNSRQD